jgi:hypothetical protein
MRLDKDGDSIPLIQQKPDDFADNEARIMDPLSLKACVWSIYVKKGACLNFSTELM